MKNNDEDFDTSNVRRKEDLKDFLDKVESQQNMGPFPIRDSSIIEELKNKLADNAVRYDNEPVTACPHCHSLYLIDNDNLECFSCGHEIEEKDVIVYRSIYSYLSRNEDSED